MQFLSLSTLSKKNYEKKKNITPINNKINKYTKNRSRRLCIFYRYKWIFKMHALKFFFSSSNKKNSSLARKERKTYSFNKMIKVGESIDNR